MKRFLTLLVGLVATSVGYSAPTYTSYFNNTHIYTNATVVGTNFAGRGVFTNGITAGASTFTGEVTSTLGTITADASALDATATWNNAGVTFSGIRMALADTASATASSFLSFLGGAAGATPMFLVSKAGAVHTPFGFQLYNSGVSGDRTASIVANGGSGIGGLGLASNFIVGWSSAASGSGDAGNFALLDTFLGRDGAANTIQIGRDSATAAAQTIKGPDGSGTDKVGGALQLGGGKSTGTAAGGALIFHTANSAGASGSSQNAITERFHAIPKWVTLTSATATTLFTIPIPATNYVGLTATVTVYATDGTDHQSKTSVITFDGIAKTTVVTSTISQVDNSTAASSGTLTVTYSKDDGTANTGIIKLAADSSLSETVLRAKIVVTAINSNGTAAVTEQ